MVILTRPVSYSENFLRSRTACGDFYKNFQIISTYSKEVSKDLLFKAIRKALIDYVILTCNIFKKDDHCIFRPISKILFDDVVTVDRTRVVDVKFFEDFNEEVKFELYCEAPLFQVLLLNDNKICAAFEHTIMDGVAGVNFHEILLQNFSYIDNHPDEYQTKYGDNVHGILFDYEKDKGKIVYSLPPAVDDCLEHYSVDYTDDPNHFTKVIPEGKTKWGGLHLSKRGYQTSYNIINFTPKELSQMLQQCKQRGVSFTAFITIMHALTVSPIIGEDHYSVYKIAVNLRRHLNPEKVEQEDIKRDLQDKDHFVLGSYALGGMVQNLPPIKEFLWEDVKRVNENLLATVSNKRALNLMKGFNDTASLHDDNLEFFQSFVGTPRSDAVRFSNLGCVSAKEEGGWEITDIIFAQDMGVLGGEFHFNLVSTPLGGLNIVWCYFKDNGKQCLGYETKFKENMLSIL